MHDENFVNYRSNKYFMVKHGGMECKKRLLILVEQTNKKLNCMDTSAENTYSS